MNCTSSDTPRGSYISNGAVLMGALSYGISLKLRGGTRRVAESIVVGQAAGKTYFRGTKVLKADWFGERRWYT